MGLPLADANSVGGALYIFVYSVSSHSLASLEAQGDLFVNNSLSISGSATSAEGTFAGGLFVWVFFCVCVCVSPLESAIQKLSPTHTPCSD